MEVVGAFGAALVSFAALVAWIVLDGAQRRLPPEDLRALRRVAGGGPLTTRGGPAGPGMRVVIVPFPDAAYPMLQMIDETRGPGHARFADAPCAAWLEQVARELMGSSASGTFEEVCAALERERRAQEGDVEVLVGQPLPPSPAG
jgi:hypothetical protein